MSVSHYQRDQQSSIIPEPVGNQSANMLTSKQSRKSAALQNTSLLSIASQLLWQDGDRLVVHQDAEFPARCVKCNCRTNGAYLTRKFSWHNPVWSMLILFNVLIYYVVALQVTRRMKLRIGICEAHLIQRRKLLSSGWVISSFGLIGLVLGLLGYHTVTTIPVGLLLTLIGASIAVYGARILHIDKIEDNYLWLEGVDENFLNQLPPWPGK